MPLLCRARLLWQTNDKPRGISRVRPDIVIEELNLNPLVECIYYRSFKIR
ncbi:MAG: hypothetical protein CM1200mP26_17640 [Acidimicrobiales bacterium]|nr:MAG: hypothetical protein CM1200mP26_17640 [Acidimicrobiales bacterium]